MVIEAMTACLLIFGCAGFGQVLATNEQLPRLLVEVKLPAAIIHFPERIQMSLPMAYQSGLTEIGQFIADLEKERRIGRVSGEIAGLFGESRGADDDYQKARAQSMVAMIARTFRRDCWKMPKDRFDDEAF
jgi:hypothetical protein